jgi:uncharacterized protein YggT (Ycf19 family)
MPDLETRTTKSTIDEVHGDGTVFRDRETAPVVTGTNTERRVGTMMQYDSIASRINTLLFAALLTLEGLLLTRFTLAAFGANPTSGFVDFIYDVSYPFVRPFQDAFAARTWDEGIIEVSTLLAMGVYLGIFLLVALVVGALLPKMARSETSVHEDHVTHL